EGAGRVLGGDADGLDLDSGAWTGALCATVRERAEGLVPERFGDAPDRLCGRLRERRAALDGAPAALCHGDPRPENARRDPAGLLDWEAAVVGDPALDLVFAEEQYAGTPDVDATDRVRAALREGYRERAGSLPAGLADRRPAYRAVTFCLLQVATFEYWAPRASGDAADLAAWVEEEFAARLQAA
ncbi:MAG: phosphotransferase family protein, partial [Halobacteriaceae archaeon]